ncbi:hypothetical protein CBM2633_B90084 [Cupriavidus taiwanensis]|uniref:Uncharacterized protein n=1 Tax=Cupriavidus taiwanensis TaxID=164546 RepID=A0A375J6L1_9BURK|nr:hypothetical protein CBM2604_B60336 [Cupriavidus taiwanensis]SOZ33403.1 hypothetical protein CBM2609_B70339 [Cupriavidus taiwanensis]SOZ48715.1 hypothetical protein CBM2610_B50338 [Cupriavidus taiwanensis]SPA22793.1 hypothetical protein CBM2633_B90084 [Cupriavidus taiwanensis]SPR99800.1 hypothetical protein CBM2634_B120010 [Cupriavidus taiwanensis]
MLQPEEDFLAFVFVWNKRGGVRAISGTHDVIITFELPPWSTDGTDVSASGGNPRPQL